MSEGDRNGAALSALSIVAKLVGAPPTSETINAPESTYPRRLTPHLVRNMVRDAGGSRHRGGSISTTLPWLAWITRALA
jgi:hypothetical protein